MVDVLVVGAGPAGSVAATVLARAGARVLLVDRAGLPRQGPSADLIYPKARALLAELDLGVAAGEGRAFETMLVAGPGGSCVSIPYRSGTGGLVFDRGRLDRALLEAAERAGARVQERVEAVAPLFFEQGTRRAVRGAVLRLESGRNLRVPAQATILADGVHSRMACDLALSRVLARPRRWAFAALFDRIEGLGGSPELHLRRRARVSITPLGGQLARICLVVDDDVADTLPSFVKSWLRCDRWLAPRVEHLTALEPPVAVVLPHVEIASAGTEGLLLAGDAALAPEPLMTDGLHRAMLGGRLAAGETIRELEHPTGLAHRRLWARRVVELEEWRSTVWLRRTLHDRPWAVRATTLGARLLPGATHRMMRKAAAAGE